MLQLISPNESHEQEWKTILSEWDSSRKRPRIFFQDSYDIFLEKVLKLAESDDIENQIPRSSIFFLKSLDENKIVGFYWLRHNLQFRDDEKLSGHIGYGIRPNERGKGYAKEGLRLTLLEAKKIGLGKILIACDDDNIASAKVIEANGGVFESNSFTQDGIKRRRYWIDIS